MAIASSSSSSSSGSDSNVVKLPLKRKLDNSDQDSDSDESSSSSSDEEESKVHHGKTKASKEKGQIKVVEGEDVVGDDLNSEEEAEEEVRVLSHKEQRRLKKKQKLADETSADPSNSTEAARTKEKKDKTGKDVLPKRQNSVWVGNLTFRTTPDMMRTFFEGVGEITRVHMPMKSVLGGAGPKVAKAENRGPLLSHLSEKNLDGRRLLIKDGGDFTGRPAPTNAATAASGAPGDSSAPATGSNTGLSKTAQKILSVQKQPAGPCLFLGNLGFEATEASIRGMMVGHAKALAQMRAEKAKGKGKKRKEGKDDDLLDVKHEEDEDEKKDGEDEEDVPVDIDVGIKKVRLGTFEDSGLCKAHATATLTNTRNHFLDGRKLVVEYASPDAARRGGHREKGAGWAAEGRRSPRKKYAKREDGDEESKGGRLPRRKREDQQDGGGENAGGDGEEADVPRADGKRTRSDDKSTRPSKRTKPGAALALAQREKYAIVPSEGTRLTFS
ncbi:RNA-binding domain-containing protein [Phellopilus nigrolimitatus]|nr:RNA-binding domain-containing protein [Phellopilus nigrolimitatus]